MYQNNYGHKPSMSTQYPTSPPPYSHHYGQQSPTSPYGHGAPPPPPRTHSQSFSGATGYTPVNFNAPLGQITPEQFYGSLIDASNRPSEVFSRMSDALFFFADNYCDVPGLRGTGLIEAGKYAWYVQKMDPTIPRDCAILCEQTLHELFEGLAVPYSYRTTANGGQTAVLDRRGWLHFNTALAREDPIDVHKDWCKAMSLFNLIDPATQRPFPVSIPRSAFPLYADNNLHAAMVMWQSGLTIALQRERSNAMISNMFSNVNKPYLAAGGATALGAGALGGYGGSGGGDGGGGGGGGGGGDHATTLDTINTVGTLANTLIGALGGGNTGGTGGLGGLGALGGLGGMNAFGFGGNGFGF